MDTKELSADKIDLGRRFLEGLQGTELIVSSAFWFLVPDSGWKLMITSAYLDRLPPVEAYNLLRQRLTTVLGADNGLINNVSIINSGDSLISVLKTAISTGPDSIAGIRFKNNVINNFYIEDAYIYRIS